MKADSFATLVKLAGKLSVEPIIRIVTVKESEIISV
jgi:hypothetical protein